VTTVAELVSKLRVRLIGSVESPALEAELLVADALGIARGELWRREREIAAADVVQRACTLAARRLRGEPVAYLLRSREFFGRNFAVRPGVLIPRPETEHLVEVVLRVRPRGRFADVGTGSGIVAITLAAECPELHVLAVDLSPHAVACARANAAALEVESRVEIVRGDLLTMVPATPCLDGIVSNPPYIEPADFDRLDPTVQKFEPRLALTPAEGSARFRARLIEAAVARLKPGGLLAFEVGAGQAGTAREQLLAAGFRDVAIENDLAGIGRVVSVRHRLDA
jgi:release factor glutamine methyltransferase